MTSIDCLLNAEYLKYSALEELIYLPKTTQEERKECIEKIIEIERRMENIVNEKYGWGAKI